MTLSLNDTLLLFVSDIVENLLKLFFISIEGHRSDSISNSYAIFRLAHNSICTIFILALSTFSLTVKY